MIDQLFITKTIRKLHRRIFKMKTRMSIASSSKDVVKTLSNHLYNLISNSDKKFNDVIFVCIGTDRSTGDSLAPLIGYKIHKKYTTYGTVHNPVHAKNLDEVMSKIDTKNNLIIAIDACLGKMDHVGYITIDKGSLKPGSGVGKDLIEVGDISICGIVNFGGFMDFLVLQNTRLSLVINLSEIITKTIYNTMKRVHKSQLKKTA
jgi:putative sporulation protein YyaC